MKISLLSVIGFFTKNWKPLYSIIGVAVEIVTSQESRSVLSSTKKKAAFDTLREVLPENISNNWLNLAIELALAILRFRSA